MRFFVFLLAASAFAASAAVWDRIHFGDFESEKAHSFSGEFMERIDGEFQVSARRLLPQETENYQGGKLYFHMRVNPRKLNYLTVKYWGGEANPNLLVLSVDGKQLGYRYLGEIDVLDEGSAAPPAPGRFYYVTMPVPVSATYGKDKVVVEIRATGPVRHFGRGFINYQLPMLLPSRAVYAFYIHDNVFFTPDAGETRGLIPEAKTNPAKPEVPLEALAMRVNREINRLLAPKNVRIGNQAEMRFLAHAYTSAWCEAYRNPRVLQSVAGGLDNCFRRLRQDPLLAGGDRSLHLSQFASFGPAAEAAVLLFDDLKPGLDEMIPDETGKMISRRRAWAEVFEAGVNHLAAARSFHPAQAMTGDGNLHWCNRALKLLEPARGLPLSQTLEFLHEAAGLRPWSGPAGGGGNFAKGEKIFTGKGLAKLPDPAGGSEEELGALYRLYDATRPGPGQKGDPALLGALQKCFRARSYFRYPAFDAAGFAVMRQEGVTNWYCSGLPGRAAGGELWSNDGTPLQAACETADPVAWGAVNMALVCGEIPAVLEASRPENMVRLLRLPGDLARRLKADSPVEPLPMLRKESFIFTDEENGLLALKDGDSILYGAFYWRARYGINFLARFHHITPDLERIATVRQEIEFERTRLFYSRPNWSNFGFGNGGVGYPGKILSLHEGETLPLPNIPALPGFQPGPEHPAAGRGDYYSCSYGPYLFGMNATDDKEFELKVPAGTVKYQVFPGGEIVKPETVLTVKPLSTIVLKEMK